VLHAASAITINHHDFMTGLGAYFSLVSSRMSIFALVLSSLEGSLLEKVVHEIPDRAIPTFLLHFS